MRIDDFGENADVVKWIFRGENLTWGNSELKIGKMGDHRILRIIGWSLNFISILDNCKTLIHFWIRRQRTPL